jgi:hypothetical protein
VSGQDGLTTHPASPSGRNLDRGPRRIPFLAANVGGIPELLHCDDHPSHLFRPTPPELALVLSRRELETSDPEFSSGKWRIIWQQNRYLGAARNTGWREARGQYDLFHDDDNDSMPQLRQVLVDAADYSRADIVTAAMAVFSDSAPPDSGNRTDRREIWAPLGSALSLGAFENRFGDAHALVRRRVLEATGGFSEDYAVGHEDWEFFARSSLADYTLLAVPIPLFWYRKSADSMLRTRSVPDADFLMSARPYLAMRLTRPLRNLRSRVLEKPCDPDQFVPAAIRDRRVPANHTTLQFAQLGHHGPGTVASPTLAMAALLIIVPASAARLESEASAIAGVKSTQMIRISSSYGISHANPVLIG